MVDQLQSRRELYHHTNNSHQTLAWVFGSLLIKGGHDSGSRFTWTCDAGNRRAKLATCDRFQTRGKPVNRYWDLPQILAPMLVLNSKTATIGKVLVLLVQTFVPTGLPVPAGHNRNKNGDLQPGITRGKPVPGPAG
ncbi:hypothetical protein BT96DRAFT_949617 [Gymnopus androsaceus JB14]|uniref:Uncharacterized protein n=1 Tax=Gymnopus androsaceus JB14 TaxID=1447944 RepID=A0A6A4GJG8_9AGAR|nr:hypothetical protein BT96DRAFT_949617 [Gymnopus androsaceus JB14]